jgi:hypothetical protein
MDSFESILDECISALQAGVSLDEVLAEVPDYADELRPLLYASMLLADPNPKLAPAQKKAELRAEYLKQVAELPALPSPTFTQKTQAITHIIRRRLTREAVLNDLVTVAITIILTLGMMAFLLNYLAADTLPGDLLYNVKRMGETIRLTTTFAENQQASLRAEYNERRLQEIEQLIEQKQAALVEFVGLLEAKGENLWVIEGYPVVLPEDLVLAETLEEGDRVEVIGLLRTNGVLVADTIRSAP